MWLTSWLTLAMSQQSSQCKRSMKIAFCKCFDRGSQWCNAQTNERVVEAEGRGICRSDVSREVHVYSRLTSLLRHTRAGLKQGFEAV